MILVTGGAGYIGSVLVKVLLERGYKVKVVDKLFFGDKGLAKVKNKIILLKKDFIDLTPADFKDVEGVIHLASTAQADPQKVLPYQVYVANFEGTLKLVELCKKMGVKRFTFASTTSVYGHRAHDREITEKMDVEPDERYGEIKVLTERYLIRETNKNFWPVIIRQGTVCGLSPRMRFDLVVNTMTRDAFFKRKIRVSGKGDLWRPLIYIKDVCTSHIVLLENAEKASGNIFNLASST